MSDEWAVPSGMTPQDNPGQPKDGIGALVKRIRDNATEMRDRFNNLLQQAGIRVEENLVRFLGAVRIEGDVRIMGAAHIEGTLDLPAGIIGNDALANPIVPDSLTGLGSGFAVGAETWETKASTTLTTPAGFTEAAVFAFAYVRILNTSGSNTGFSLAGKVAGVSGDVIDRSIPSGTFENASVGVVKLVSGLTGGSTVLVETRLYSHAAFSTTVENTATIRGLVFWFR